jgi:hypothetical protein
MEIKLLREGFSEKQKTSISYSFSNKKEQTNTKQ